MRNRRRKNASLLSDLSVISFLMLYLSREKRIFAVRGHIWEANTSLKPFTK